MLRFTWTWWLGMVFLLSCAATICRGQQITGEIDGVVRDPSGAAIPGATVTVLNMDTNQVVRNLKSNSHGEYAATVLQVGNYSVAAEAPGFEKTEITGIALAVGDTLTHDIQLKPGSTEHVSVSASDSLQPNLETNENSTLLTSTAVKELALNTRNFEQILLLQPGVSYGGPDELMTSQVDASGNRNSQELSINGLQPSQVMFLLDGADMLNHTSNNQVSIFPSIDAIQQIQTVRNNYGAQYGGGGSAQVGIVTHAGGAQFHGAAYYFFRNQALDATPVFDLLNNPPLPKPPLRYNDFGYTVGGPLFIPGLYPRDRSKTFFFVSQEFRRIGQTIQTVEDDFPSLPQTYGYFTTPVCIYFQVNSTTCSTAAGSRAVAVANSPYAGYNYQIPPADLDLVALEYMKDIFRPSIALAPPPFDPALPNDVIFSERSTQSETQELVRIDHQFGERLNGFFRWIYDPNTQNIPNAIYSGIGFPGVTDTTVHTYGEDFLGHVTWAVRASTVLEFGVSFLPYETDATPTGTAVAANSPDINVNLPFANTTGRVPELSLFGGVYGATGPFKDHSHTLQAFENTTQQHGRHVFYFGVNFEQLTDSSNLGTLNSGEFTFLSQQSKDTATGLVSPVFDETFAQVLTGQADSFTQASIDASSNLREYLYESYFQDSYRATARLTLNGGLRYSVFKAPGDFSDSSGFPRGKLGDFQPEGFNAATEATIGSDGSLCSAAYAKQAVCQGFTPNPNYNPLDGIVGGGASPSPYGHSISRTPLLDFAPRVGFAWNVYGDGKASLRGGFGIFYEQQPLVTFQNAVGGNPAYVQNPVYNLPPSLGNPTGASTATSSTGGAISYISGIARNWKQPYVESWDLDVQQQFGKNSMFDISYVGNNTLHLQGEEDLNQPPSGLYLATNVTGGAEVVAKTATIQDLNRIRPYLGYGPINYISTRYFADYNGLQVSLLNRTSKSLVLGIHYTFSKGMANSLGPPTTANGLTQADPQNRFCLRCEWGLTQLDRRNSFVASGVYELPSHSAWHGLRGRLVNGWEVSTILQFISGLWFSPFEAGYDPGGQGGLSTGTRAKLRPNELSDPNHGPKTQLQFFNVLAFAPNNTAQATAIGAPYKSMPIGEAGGSAHVSSILGPGSENVTLALFKNIELPEQIRFQIRAEAFNLPNHVNWKNLNYNATSADFGQVTSAYDNREVQFGAKLIW